MRARVAAEERRVATIRALQEARLFEWQAQHADQTRDWQARRAAYERQKHWYAVSLACDIDRVDVAGGTLCRLVRHAHHDRDAAAASPAAS